MSEEQQDFESRTDKESLKRVKRIIIISIVAIFIIMLAGIIYYVSTQKSAIAQVNDFSKAVDKKNYKTLSELLSTNKQKMTHNDMEYFVNYINTGNNKQKFDKEINKIKNDIKSDEKYNVDLGKITDNNGRTIVNVRPNGKKLFILDKVTFEPNLSKVYIKGSNDETEYKYLRGDKEVDILSSGQKETEIGSFMVGDFDLDTTKTFKDSLASDNDVDGQLHVNTDKVSKNGKIYATEKFDQAWFKVNFKNDSKLDESKSLFIDGNKVSYDSKKTYGKFAARQPLILSAKGKIGDNTIETNTVEVKANQEDKPQTINLEFDKDEIDKHVKEEKEIQDEAEKFMTEYTEDLNKAYKDGQFAHVSNYFENDSDLANYIESKVKTKNKSKYSKPKFKKFDRDGESITMVLEKEDKHGNNISSEYKLKYREDGLIKFKIDEYKDI